MGIYQETPLGSNLSVLVGLIETQHDAIRSFERGTVTPTVLTIGSVHNKTDHSTLGEAWMRYNGSGWDLLLDPEATQINDAGTVAFAADQPMGGFKLTGLAAGSGAGHSVRYEQAILVNGANAFTADQSMGSHKLTNLAAPSSANDAARLTDVQPSKTAVADRDENPVIEVGGDHASTYQPGILLGDGSTRVMPLLMHIRMSGAVTKQSDSSAVTTLTERNYLVPRHDESTITLESVTLGVGTLDIILEWKTTTPHGFWLRLVKSVGGDYCDVANVSVIMVGAKGEG